MVANVRGFTARPADRPFRGVTQVHINFSFTQLPKGAFMTETKAPTCPKCSSPMEAGFILDKIDDSRLKTPEWIEGNPEPAFWTGLKVKGRDRLNIITYRCERCGLLESYAT